jgi:hypothetical protein
VGAANGTSTNLHPKANMFTADGSVRAQQAQAHPRSSEELKQQKQRAPSLFFPLGYKEAAYQWVSSQP